MVNILEIRRQLSSCGYINTSWQRAEVKELCNVINEGEKIVCAVNGHYEGGFALLVATNHRLILVDRKVMFLTLDSITYQMIQEVSFNYRLFNSTIHIFTSNKCLDFNTWSHARIRTIFSYSQSRILQARIDTDNYIKDQITQQHEMLSLARNGVTPQSYRPEVEQKLNLPGEIPSEEIPVMPAPLGQDLPKMENSILNLGFSAINNKGGTLAAYKMPGLNGRRFLREIV